MIDNFIVYQFQLLLWEGNNKALFQIVSWMYLWLRAAVKRENQPCYYHVMITIVSRVAYILGLYHHFKWICRIHLPLFSRDVSLLPGKGSGVTLKDMG